MISPFHRNKKGRGAILNKKVDLPQEVLISRAALKIFLLGLITGKTWLDAGSYKANSNHFNSHLQEIGELS